MKIPDRVKIAGYDYTVERFDESFTSADGTILCDGEHQGANQIIKVVNKGTEEYQMTVFLHEVIHAIIHSYTTNEQDEGFVEQVSKGLYQVIKDNPEIFI